MNQMTPPAPRAGAYSGYRLRTAPPPDPFLSQVGPGTPCGELMRRYWQPVALASELGDKPLLVKVLGETLVAFRDGSGRIGVLQSRDQGNVGSPRAARPSPGSR